MLDGAIYSLLSRDYPERIVHFAHSCRELLDKLPDRLVGPVAHTSALVGVVAKLRTYWDGVEVPSLFAEHSELTTQQLRFLVQASSFFKDFDSRPSTRHDQVGRVRGKLDPRGRRLGERIEREHVRRWLTLRREFTVIAHHERVPTAGECTSLLDRLESLLIDALRPPTFEHREEIDRIIAEAEGSP